MNHEWNWVWKKYRIRKCFNYRKGESVCLYGTHSTWRAPLDDPIARRPHPTSLYMTAFTRRPYSRESTRHSSPDGYHPTIPTRRLPPDGYHPTVTTRRSLPDDPRRFPRGDPTVPTWHSNPTIPTRRSPLLYVLICRPHLTSQPDGSDERHQPWRSNW